MRHDLTRHAEHRPARRAAWRRPTHRATKSCPTRPSRLRGATCHQSSPAERVCALPALPPRLDAPYPHGAGHVGVGSIVELSNAKAAALVGADVVLVANGGLGKAFDELEMNRHVFAQEGVAVRGVVLNKVPATHATYVTCVTVHTPRCMCHTRHTRYAHYMRHSAYVTLHKLHLLLDQVMPDKVEMVRDKMGQLLQQRCAGCARGVCGCGTLCHPPFIHRMIFIIHSSFTN